MSAQIGVIQRILGHRNRKATEGYLHSICESERKAMENLDLYLVDTLIISGGQINKGGGKK